MKIAIIFATSDGQLDQFFGTKQLGAIPKEIRRSLESKGGRITYVGHLDLSQINSEVAIANRFLQAGELCDCLLVICCSTVSHLISDFKDAVFLYEWDLTTLRQNYLNNARSVISRALKKYLFFKRNFDDLKYRKILLLPLENFCADEIREMRFLLTNSAREPEFFARLQTNLAAFRSRVKPKRSNAYPTRYLIDDNGHHYEYGHERHSGPGTARPPHRPICELNGRFRFGSEYDLKQHYNVTVDGAQIQATFQNCHGLIEPLGPKSHVNLFPNGGI